MPGDGDLVRVDAVLRGVGPHPAHGGLRVVLRVAERGLVLLDLQLRHRGQEAVGDVRVQAVVDREHDVPGLHELLAGPCVPLDLLAALAEVAAVDPDHRRSSGGRVAARLEHVEAVLLQHALARRRLPVDEVLGGRPRREHLVEVPDPRRLRPRRRHDPAQRQEQRRANDEHHASHTRPSRHRPAPRHRVPR